MKGKLSLQILGQPDPNVPKDVHLVGRYALGVDWADGHGSIYPFEHLRRGCPCGACAALETLTPAMGWPRDIKRVEGALSIAWSDAHESRYPFAELRALCRCAACTGGH
ncbi:MAG TPA: gamma-butyrobetaine hydroxylase-like domain-containing protein [Methylomirabilota bacterium]|nr:gamma-butyrobetaine hydroxylase-like domain-containing protein [Methylomirabilota bacterium]